MGGAAAVLYGGDQVYADSTWKVAAASSQREYFDLYRQSFGHIARRKRGRRYVDQRDQDAIDMASKMMSFNSLKNDIFDILEDSSEEDTWNSEEEDEVDRCLLGNR